MAKKKAATKQTSKALDPETHGTGSVLLCEAIKEIKPANAKAGDAFTATAEALKSHGLKPGTDYAPRGTYPDQRVPDLALKPEAKANDE